MSILLTKLILLKVHVSWGQECGDGTVAYLLKVMAIPMAQKVHTSMRN